VPTVNFGSYGLRLCYFNVNSRLYKQLEYGLRIIVAPLFMNFTRIHKATSVFLPSTLHVTNIGVWWLVLLIREIQNLDPCRDFDNNVWCFFSWKTRGKYWMSGLIYDTFRHSQNYPRKIIRFYVSGRLRKGIGQFSLCTPWKRLTTVCTVRGSNSGGGEIFCTRPDRPWGPPSLLYNGYRVFPGGNATGAWCWPHTPS
jgi:hypothetical protein